MDTLSHNSTWFLREMRLVCRLASYLYPDSPVQYVPSHRIIDVLRFEVPVLLSFAQILPQFLQACVEHTEVHLGTNTLGLTNSFDLVVDVSLLILLKQLSSSDSGALQKDRPKGCDIRGGRSRGGSRS